MRTAGLWSCPLCLVSCCNLQPGCRFLRWKIPFSATPKNQSASGFSEFRNSFRYSHYIRLVSDIQKTLHDWKVPAKTNKCWCPVFSSIVADLFGHRWSFIKISKFTHYCILVLKIQSQIFRFVVDLLHSLLYDKWKGLQQIRNISTCPYIYLLWTQDNLTANRSDRVFCVSTCCRLVAANHRLAFNVCLLIYF